MAGEFEQPGAAEIQTQTEAIETQPEVGEAVSEAVKGMHEAVVNFQPLPGESAADFKSRLVPVLVFWGNKITDQYPAKPSPSAELFK